MANLIFGLYVLSLDISFAVEMLDVATLLTHHADFVLCRSIG